MFCFRILGIDGKESLFFGAAFCFFFSESLNCVLVLVNGMLVQYMQNDYSVPFAKGLRWLLVVSVV